MLRATRLTDLDPSVSLCQQWPGQQLSLWVSELCLG